MKLNPESIARASSHRPWVTVGVWILVMAAAAVAANAFLGEVLTTEFDFTDDPESKQAQTLVEDRLRGPAKFTEYVVVTSDATTALDAEYQQLVTALTVRIGEDLGPDKVDFVGSFLTATGPVSQDGRTALLPVQMARTDLDEESSDAKDLATSVALVDVPAGFDVLIAGQGTVNNDYVRLSEETLRRGEGIGVAIALIVLLVVIGTVVAALLPLALAVAAITAAMGVASLVGLTFELSFFVTNMISGIGLAVGIDYALFIVARYREERVRGFDKLEAIGRAGATANRAVFFSGLTVVLALLGMLFVPNTIFRSLGVGAITVVVFAVAASMSLLPAILSLLGDRVNKGRVRRQRALDNVDKTGGFWDKATTAVMKRPVVWLVAAAGLMASLSLFYWQTDLGFAGVTTLPDGTESKRAFELLEKEFAGGLTNPVEVVIDGPITPEVEAALGDLRAAVAADPAFGPFDPINATEVNEARDLALFSFPLAGDFQSQQATDAVRSLRATMVPTAFAGVDANVLVGGFTAFTVDFFADVDTYTPIVFLFVLGLSFVLLTVVFRSLVVPIKAIILNLLSVGAAYGMLAIFFMRGVGPSWAKDISDFLGFIEVESIEAWLPLFLFSVLFGLSMDYHVFLISRIREAYDRTGDNAAAVAHGLRTTGAIITGAALIMVAVFSGFAAGDVASLQQMGFGLAVAVFLDATVVRSILVPATMRLLGDFNWYLPSWLEWIPQVEIEGHEAAAARRELVEVSD